MTHRRATAISCGSGNKGSRRLFEHLRSLRLGLVYTIRTFRYPHHFCLTLVRRRRARDGKRASEGTESERGQYEIDDALIFCLAPSFGRLTLRPLCARRACAMVASAYGEHGTRFAKSWRRPDISLFCALGELVKLRPLLYYIYLKLFMTLLCKIRQLLGRKVDKRRKMAVSLLALLKINF